MHQSDQFAMTCRLEIHSRPSSLFPTNQCAQLKIQRRGASGLGLSSAITGWRKASRHVMAPRIWKEEVGLPVGVNCVMFKLRYCRDVELHCQ